MRLVIDEYGARPGGDTADPDVRLLSDEDIEQARREGQRKEQEETAQTA